MVVKGNNIIEKLKNVQRVIESASVELKHKIIYLEAADDNRTTADCTLDLLSAIHSIDYMNQNIRCVDLFRGLMMDQKS